MTLSWPLVSVKRLQDEQVLFVEDGNHGADRPRSDEFGRDGMCFVRAADMVDGRVEFGRTSRINDIARHRIRKGFGRDLDVLLSHKGTVGKVALVPRGSPAFVCSPQTTYWRSLNHRRLDPRFLRYFMTSPAFVRQLAARSGETDMAAYVSLTEQRNLSVLLPPIEEQRGIAATLGALDDKIESNRRVIDIVPRLIRSSLVRSLGGDRESVPVADLARFVNGGAYTKNATGSGRMVIRIADLNSGPGASTVYNELDVPDDRLARPGDLLMSWSGSLGVYRWTREEAIVNQHIFKVLPAGKPDWLVFDRLDHVIDVFRGIAKDKATTMGHIQRGHLESTMVDLPPSASIERLDPFLGPLWQRLLISERESLRLESLRDTLLPELMSGRIRVPEAADVVEEAVS